MENLGHQIGRELEVAQAIHASMDRSVGKLTTIVEHQTDRLDTLDRTVARGLGALAVILVLTNLLLPVLTRLLT